MKLDEQLARIESALHKKKCMEVPYTENILEIRGVGENILAGDLKRTTSAKSLTGVFNGIASTE